MLAGAEFEERSSVLQARSLHVQMREASVNSAFGSQAWFSLNRAWNLKSSQKEMKQKGGESGPRSGGLITRLRNVALVQEAAWRELSKVLGQACCDSQHQNE